MTMKSLTLPQAIVASTVLLVIGVLSWSGKETAAYVTAALFILGALGILVKQNTEVKAATDTQLQQTNGNTKALLEIITSQQVQMVAMAHKMATMVPMEAVGSLSPALPADPTAPPAPSAPYQPIVNASAVSTL